MPTLTKNKLYRNPWRPNQIMRYKGCENEFYIFEYGTYNPETKTFKPYGKAHTAKLSKQDTYKLDRIDT